MTLRELVDAVILKATGKATALEPGGAKYEKIRGIANSYQHVWEHEPGQTWNSLYERARQIGTISTKDAYELDEDIAEISTARGDDVYIQSLDGRKIPYTLVTYDDLRNYQSEKVCAKIGNELVFNHQFTQDDPEYGGKIYAPIYRSLEDLESADDDIAIDDPYWLVFMTAAEYIRNDIVKQNQYGNLINEANNLMSSMIRRNRGGSQKIRGEWRNPGGAR